MGRIVSNRRSIKLPLDSRLRGNDMVDDAVSFDNLKYAKQSHCAVKYWRIFDYRRAMDGAHTRVLAILGLPGWRSGRYTNHESDT